MTTNMLVFIGLKMLVEYFNIHVPVYISLMVILVSIAACIVYSISIEARRTKDGGEDDNMEPIS